VQSTPQGGGTASFLAWFLRMQTVCQKKKKKNLSKRLTRADILRRMVVSGANDAPRFPRSFPMSATFLAPPRFTARVYDVCGSIIREFGSTDMTALERVVRGDWAGSEDAHRFAIINGNDEEVMYDTV